MYEYEEDSDIIPTLIVSDGEVIFEQGKMWNCDVTLYNGTLTIKNAALFRNKLSLEGGILNLINNKIETFKVTDFSSQSAAKLNIDANLPNTFIVLSPLV